MSFCRMFMRALIALIVHRSGMLVNLCGSFVMLRSLRMSIFRHGNFPSIDQRPFIRPSQ